MSNIRNFTNLDTDYYDVDANFGNHQYTVLKDIVNNFMYSQDNDSYMSNVDMHRVVYHAKRSVQELYYDVFNEVISIEFEISPTFLIALPHDYVQYVRISWVDELGKLHPLAVDNTSNLSQAYLQDNDFNFLFDGSGDILQGSHIQDLGQTSSSSRTNIENLVTNRDGFFLNNQNEDFNLNRAKLFRNGSFRIDKDRGVIQFSSAVEERTIVIEYISDGLFQRPDTDIRVHKFAEKAVYDFIYYQLVQHNKNVPEREKIRAERTWWNSRRISKRRLGGLNMEDFRQMMKSQSKMIKD